MTTEQKRMLFVLAETHQQFKAWCLDNDKSFHDPNIRYIYTESDLRGMNDFDYTIYGTPHRRKDFNDIMFLLKDAKMYRGTKFIETKQRYG